MANIFDIAPDDLIKKAAQELKEKKIVSPPEWSEYVKTGMFKQRPPQDDDWWYVRCAALLRTIFKLGPIGVNKLRTKYGGKKNRGHKPEKFYRGSGSVIRKAIQQLEKAGYVKQIEKGLHKGRIVTPTGKSFLDKIVISLVKASPRKVEAKKEEVVEEKKVKKEKLSKDKNVESKKEVKNVETKEELTKEK